MTSFLEKQKDFFFFLFAVGVIVLLLHSEIWYDYYYTNWQIHRKYNGFLKTWRLQSELGGELGTLQS